MNTDISGDCFSMAVLSNRINPRCSCTYIVVLKYCLFQKYFFGGGAGPPCTVPSKSYTIGYYHSVHRGDIVANFELTQ